MKRRHFVGAGAVAGAASALPAPAIAQGVIQTKLIGAFPRGFPGVGVAAERLAARIEAVTDGKIAVEYHGGGELAPPFGVFDAVSTGVAEFGHTAPYFAAGAVKSTMYFTSMPFGLSQEELLGWLRYGGGQALWDEAYAPFGVTPFYCGGSGTQSAGWFKNPIQSLADLEGLKMRIAGLGGAVLQKLGVAPQNLPPPEIFQALQTGVVDAAEFVGPWNDVALGLYKVAPYYYAPAFHEPGPALECIVRTEFLESLPAATQAQIRAAIAQIGEETYADFRYHNTRVLQDLVAKGAIVGVFPDDVVEAIGGAAREVIEAFPGDDAMAQKVHAGYFDYVRQCAEYGAAVEGAMYAQRAKVWGV